MTETPGQGPRARPVADWLPLLAVLAGRSYPQELGRRGHRRCSHVSALEVKSELAPRICLWSLAQPATLTTKGSVLPVPGMEIVSLIQKVVDNHLAPLLLF